jgi:hypothetical protein
MPWVTADSEWEFYRETKGKEEGSFAGGCTPEEWWEVKGGFFVFSYGT